MPPKLQISPIDSFIDEEVSIKVIGCLKNTQVSIHATFVANHEGIVNVSLQKPIEGTYDKVDGSDLFWFMEHTESNFGDYYV